MKTIIIGSDFAGFGLKTILSAYIKELGYSVEDYGCTSVEDKTHYPFIAKRVCDKIIESNYEKQGMLICGTGVGMAMSANKCKGIRAVVAHDAFSSARSRLSNNANVVCMGQGVIGPDLAKKILAEWLSLEFTDPAAAERVAAICEVESITMK